MSQDEGDDINFNELVGNLLSTHNASNRNEENDDNSSNVPENSFLKQNLPQDEDTNHVDLPDFNVEGDDDALAAVVANAIENMDQEGAPSEDFFEQEHAGNVSKEQIEEHQQEDWARILEQGLLQGTDTDAIPDGQIDVPQEQLDQDDENLRRAILESLQELNVDSNDKGTSAKKSSKKSSKKKKKDKTKEKDPEKQKSATSKKKKRSKDHKKSKHAKSAESTSISEDVIRGFMQRGAGSSEAEIDQPADTEDAETHALVEATLKAFERELLGTPTITPVTQQRKTASKKKSATNAPSSTKKKTSSKKKPEKAETVRIDPTSSTTLIHPTINQLSGPTEEDKKKDNKKKKKKAAKDISESNEVYEDDEFSKALAEMVNQVVNTSLTETTNQPSEAVTKQQKEFVEPLTVPEENKKIERRKSNEDSFDLNQIMQKAMTLAFQEQHQEGLDNSVMEDFNRGLGDFGVTNVLDPTSVEIKKKKSSKASAKKTPPKKKKIGKSSTSIEASGLREEPFRKVKPAKPKREKILPSRDELFKKKYHQAARAAASAARKLITERNKASKASLRMERKVAREEKRRKKKQEEEELARERKELKDIVAKGPPYPPDLRLTKSGKPKKPYRRWTKEEMDKRAAVPADNLNRIKKEKKVKKKKSKKLKRVPLSTLKKIPLFNFVKGNVPSDIRQKLNGIDESLKKIPLQNYKLDINRLAPPEKVSKEEMERFDAIKEDFDAAIKLKKSFALASFDITRKTVIRREKIALHPPWAIPSQPPFALPVARRRRKERTKKLKDFKSDRNSRKRQRDYSIAFNARNRIIPAVLFPIINTLKAAAKAKAASGASSEEASNHLLTIIKHTKKSIAQTLQMSRRNYKQDYSTMKTESDINRSQERMKRVRRMPIFSLANIRQVEAKERASSQSLQEKSTPPSVIKIEEGTVPQDSLKDIPGDDHKVTFEINPNFSSKETAIEPIAIVGTNEAREFKVRNSSDVSVSKGPQECVDHTETGSSISQRTNKDKQDLTIVSENLSPQVISAEKGNTVLQSMATNILTTSCEKETTNSQNVQKSETVEHKFSSALIPSPVKNELDNEVQSLTKQSYSGEQEVRNVVEVLMKRQFSRSDGSVVDLPPNLQNIISASIGELIPAFEDENRLEATIERENKRPRRGPSQVLNLDGLVPPSAQNFVPKVERKETFSPAVTRSKPLKKKGEQPTLMYTFNIPDYRGTQGKRLMLLKRAKKHLTNDEMNALKKEMNKERKRKWREANVEKNWENDLRSRLRRRANLKFGDRDSEDKEKWFEVELAKNLADRGIKRSNETDMKKNSCSTNLSDNEVLNMIAATLNKLEVARLLERELNDEVNKKTEGERKDENSGEGKHAAFEAKKSLTEKTTDEDLSVADEKDTNQERTDELFEDGTLKRPYPDDIPVIIPLSKRPASSSSSTVS
ncbi:hypothetical protein HG535_0D05530 [Zygotorulaspora mrakii]|uniref:DUF3020 domain-containing protein n=1 Tax=Zygotorulaspora mrakii TaxID=42260 RepID=A0A7H9B372_ZYGMR|nr:uncharacterized protein HG535_0D05530 [Zygotorulaspora mrakii]QLG72844.1 hypothetical protein HG535_0D05530 [Zygotorulaspora mrakii]